MAAATLGLALALAAGTSAPAQDAGERGTPDRRNVLVVMTDDQRVSDAKALPRTMARIGARGVDFRKAYATFPLCCPSRASYLTGKYAHNHGVLGNSPPEGGMQKFDDSATTAVALDEAGYRTGWVGKYLNGYVAAARQDPPYVPPGWDTWRAASTPRQMYGWEQVIGNRRKRWGQSDRAYQNDVYARQAKRFVESAADREGPFFLTISPHAPHVVTLLRPLAHNPRGAFARRRLPTPPSFNEADVSDKPSFMAGRPRLDRAARRHFRDLNRDRLWSLLAVDDLVVGVMNALARNGLLDETLVIFTSDNGYLLGEHRVEGKSLFYDPATRVPLLMRGPGVDRGEVVRSPAANIDLAATIYDFTGVAPALEQDGVSLLDVAADPADFADRELLFQSARGTAIRTPEWLYAEYQTKFGNEYEMYPRSDRHQLESVHDDPTQAATRIALAARLANLRDCEGAACR